jgi:murein DD-endopeptidase MepM/ murein hydrolase activator NlpD
VDLVQPELILPFEPGHLWSFTGGPHSAWGPDGARAALDFAPASVQSGCVDSTEWVTAVAAGVVVRVDTGVVILDLDGDGYEQTGWNILYLHIKTQDKIKVGTIVRQGDRIGHPSCEGGTATGTHVHIARKYNGEWVLADGALPFVMNGWRSIAGADAYQGKLVKDDQVVEACDCGSFETRISRPADGSQ